MPSAFPAINRNCNSICSTDLSTRMSQARSTLPSGREFHPLAEVSTVFAAPLECSLFLQKSPASNAYSAYAPTIGLVIIARASASIWCHRSARDALLRKFEFTKIRFIQNCCTYGRRHLIGPLQELTN